MRMVQRANLGLMRSIIMNDGVESHGSCEPSGAKETESSLLGCLLEARLMKVDFWSTHSCHCRRCGGRNGSRAIGEISA
jgi:hypothetical protein